VSIGFLEDVKEQVPNVEQIQDVAAIKDDKDVDVVVEDVDVSLGIADLYDHDDQLDEEPVQCQNYHRFGHDESNCFDLHPCSFYGKTNRLLERCQKRKKIQRKHIHFEWLGNWLWSLEAKLLEQSGCCFLLGMMMIDSGYRIKNRWF
jgi:hypothetical protein